MTVYSVTDNAMAVQVADITASNDRAPRYVRLERHVEPNLYAADADLSDGFARLREGRDGTIVSTGIMVRESLKLAGELAKKGIELSVVDVHRFPCNEAKLAAALAEGGPLFSIEENFLQGGVGSYALEVMSDHGRVRPIKRFGIVNGWQYRYGGREDNRAAHGIDHQTLLARFSAAFQH
jgi:transketolase